MADAAETTTDANPTPAGFDFGTALNDLFRLADVIVKKYKAPQAQTATSAQLATPGASTGASPASAQAGLISGNLVWILGGVGLLWFLFRK